MQAVCQVFAGPVVLLENTTGDPRDPHNWSDLLLFWEPGAFPNPGSPANTGTYISDMEDASGNSNGITDLDLQAAGVPFPVAQIASLPNIVFIPESTSGENPYQTPPGPAGSFLYLLFSDPPEGPVPTGTVTWGHLKGHYR
jgi:hypothetical protein